MADETLRGVRLTVVEVKEVLFSKRCWRTCERTSMRVMLFFVAEHVS
jgi:hypothetical protein